VGPHGDPQLSLELDQPGREALRLLMLRTAERVRRIEEESNGRVRDGRGEDLVSVSLMITLQSRGF
jgi:hypothetical protein